MTHCTYTRKLFWLTDVKNNFQIWRLFIIFGFSSMLKHYLDKRCLVFSTEALWKKTKSKIWQGEFWNLTYADGNFGDQGRSEQSSGICLSECNILLVGLGLLALALLLSMSLNFIFCIRQRGSLFKGTSLKKWMFLKMQAVSVTHYIIHTDECCLNARKK